MNTLRRVLAAPFYLLALLFHLLCALFTWTAQCISGDNQFREGKRISSITQCITFAFLSAMPLGITVFIGLATLIYHPRETDPSRLEPVPHPWQNSEFAKSDFTPAQLAAIIPQAKLVSCIFAGKAVKHRSSPSEVKLPSCGGKDAKVVLADNLIDVTVSGIAKIANVDHQFTVTLQHNPPSVTEDGLIVTAIDVD
jgi:hypothetical protein